jgi:hypothetical protein
VIELPQLQYEHEVVFPDYEGKRPRDVWSAFFKAHRPTPDIVARIVLKLQSQEEHEHVIGCIQAALIAGQAQPWMYELLAITMEQAGRPKEEIERVVRGLWRS